MSGNLTVVLRELLCHDVSVLTQRLEMMPILDHIYCLWAHQQFVAFTYYSKLNFGDESFLFVFVPYLNLTSR